MTARHTITRADEVYVGDVVKNGYAIQGRAGIKLDVLKYVDLGAPVTAVTNGVVSAAASVTNATVTLTTGNLALTTLDAPRNLTYVGGATTVTQVVTALGTDVYGDAMTESVTMNGTTAVVGAKAFSGVSSVVIAPGTGTVDVGFGNKLGLPFRVSSNAQIVGGLLYVDNVVNTTAVVVTGLATTVVSTAGAGDVRGTVVSTGSLPNGTRRYTLTVNLPNISDQNTVFGVDQA